MGKIYARNIYNGLLTLSQVPENWKADTKAAYQEIYGVPLEEEITEKPVSGSKKRKKR